MTYDREVLSGVDLAVRRGDRIALIGPSGSGKSTLLGVLGLLVRPDDGSVTHAGGTREHMRSVGWIFQNGSAFPARTVADNVAFPLLARGVDRQHAHDRAARWLDMLGIAELGPVRASTLSGGELQRMTIARALCAGPGLVLADEPTASLDRRNAMTVIDALARGEGQHAVVIATHDPIVAAACRTRLALSDGVLEEVD